MEFEKDIMELLEILDDAINIQEEYAKAIEALEQENQFLTETIANNKLNKAASERRKLQSQMKEIQSSSEETLKKAQDIKDEYEQKLEKIATIMRDVEIKQHNVDTYIKTEASALTDGFKTEYEKYKEKGEDIMRIAVTYENGEIFQHFGHTEEFKVYDVQDGKVVASEVVNTNGQGHGALAGVLTALKADVLICGGIGGGAQMALAAAGIKLYGGVSGSADAAVEALLAGNLDYNPAVKCNHHGEHGEGHTCGEHGCGGHH